jgi:hypothetical protein
MVRFLRVAVAVFCVLCVLAICIAPHVDLPATKLSPDNFVILLLCSFMAAGTASLLKAFRNAPRSVEIWLPAPTRKKQHSLSPLETSSILRR